MNTPKEQWNRREVQSHRRRGGLRVLREEGVRLEAEEGRKEDAGQEKSGAQQLTALAESVEGSEGFN